jgi:hypothetical protein
MTGALQENNIYFYHISLSSLKNKQFFRQKLTEN